MRVYCVWLVRGCDITAEVFKTKKEAEHAWIYHGGPWPEQVKWHGWILVSRE